MRILSICSQLKISLIKGDTDASFLFENSIVPSLTCFKCVFCNKSFDIKSTSSNKNFKLYGFGVFCILMLIKLFRTFYIKGIKLDYYYVWMINF